MQNIQNEPLLESEQPSITAAPRILTPCLIVMLGSTSAIAGLEMMRHMLTLKPADQRRVVLVYIDTDDSPAPLVEFRRRHNNVFHEFPLRIAIPAGISSAAHFDPRDQHTYIRDKVPQYFANGAGGIRNNGHVAACFNYQHIYDVLDRAIVAISRLGTDQNMMKVHEVQANIVAFMGGGTGSGIISDIAVMVRDLLTHRQYKQRINLFCMLPEPISGATINDIRWRKSNAVAGLLELLAYSRAAALTPNQGYEKYMRNRMHRLTNDPIANEIYLVGHASMDNAGDTARIVGLDLFQRATDAAGLGFLEHSKWVDRRTLGAEDDRGLPTMFGTSCPLEVRFPADETARAFAQISASYLLPYLASYKQNSVQVSDPEKLEWQKKWRQVARFDANDSDPLVVKIQEFRPGDFENAAQAHLDIQWAKLGRLERETEKHIRELIDMKRREEQTRIRETPMRADNTEQTSLINQRIRYLSYLQQEYDFMLRGLREKGTPQVPQRPNDLEDRLTRRQLRGPLRMLGRDYASAVSEAYNERMYLHARAFRHQLLEQLMRDLSQQAQSALEQSTTWFQSTGVNDHVKELRDKGAASMAWHGKLEYPHPHQRHIFDLRTLRAKNDRNVAVEALYEWATGAETGSLSEGTIDYQAFIGPCIEYFTHHTPSSRDQVQSIDRHVASRLAERVVDFFHAYYLNKFETRNLFDLLTIAAPPPRDGKLRSEQISLYLLEHLQHMSGLMSSLVAFEAELWQEGLASLDTSVYMGVHWHDGVQEDILHQALNSLGTITRQGQTPSVNNSLDPHRLQVSYGQHAISLSTVRDFYLEQNSAMEYYLANQERWKTGGRGLMPVHSSGEAERLVTELDNTLGVTPLGYTKPLAELVIRRPELPRSSPRSNGHQQPSFQNRARGAYDDEEL